MRTPVCGKFAGIEPRFLGDDGQNNSGTFQLSRRGTRRYKAAHHQDVLKFPFQKPGLLFAAFFDKANAPTQADGASVIGVHGQFNLRKSSCLCRLQGCMDKAADAVLRPPRYDAHAQSPAMAFSLEARANDVAPANDVAFVLGNEFWGLPFAILPRTKAKVPSALGASGRRI